MQSILTYLWTCSKLLNIKITKVNCTHNNFLAKRAVKNLRSRRTMSDHGTHVERVNAELRTWPVRLPIQPPLASTTLIHGHLLDGRTSLNKYLSCLQQSAKLPWTTGPTHENYHMIQWKVWDVHPFNDITRYHKICQEIIASKSFFSSKEATYVEPRVVERETACFLHCCETAGSVDAWSNFVSEQLTTYSGGILKEWRCCKGPKNAAHSIGEQKIGGT